MFRHLSSGTRPPSEPAPLRNSPLPSDRTGGTAGRLSSGGRDQGQVVLPPGAMTTVTPELPNALSIAAFVQASGT